MYKQCIFLNCWLILIFLQINNYVTEMDIDRYFIYMYIYVHAYNTLDNDLGCTQFIYFTNCNLENNKNK